jgi:hypothetical protein
LGTITGASAIYTISIQTIFPTPQQLQGFAADDVFTSEPIAAAEVLMGVDGVLSSGFVYVPFRQTIALQADSASNLIFEQWWLANQTARENYAATGIIILPTISEQYSLTSGYLTSYPFTADTKKLLQPRRYQITWQLVSPSPTT